MTITADHILAREFVVEVDTAYPATAVWTEVRFRSKVDPKVTPNLEDAQTYADAGWGHQEKTGLDWSLEFTIDLYRTDTAGYAPEADLLRTQSYEFGIGGLVHVRWYNGAEAHEGLAHVSWEWANNEPRAVAQAKITLTGVGILDNDPAGIPDPVIPGSDWTTQVTGSPTGGTYTLTVVAHGVSQTATGIAFNATAADIETALEALSNLVPGDVEVTGTTTKTYNFAFPVTLSANGAGLTGGSSPGVTVVEL